ncbi:hypothetical protein PBAC_16560 [Pedobacter glucosidilyticus]|nr:hypothetical protein [Pedobacter glucosidilyticus]KHJ38115.1 hypothetical protein PBAC_16560 [Pedobacter glucosidilyticus]
MIKKITLFLFLLFGITRAFSQTPENFTIKNFIIKESFLKADKIAVIVTDSLKNPRTSINGTYKFDINGFSKDLIFHDGVANCDMPIEKSTFMYIKHENDETDVSNLYYIYKSSESLTPMSISWYFLLAIPIGLILLGYMFRKLIGLMVFTLMAYIYFNYSKGLSIGTFIESIFDGLKNLF